MKWIILKEQKEICTCTNLKGKCFSLHFFLVVKCSENVFSLHLQHLTNTINPHNLQKSFIGIFVGKKRLGICNKHIGQGQRTPLSYNPFQEDVMEELRSISIYLCIFSEYFWCSCSVYITLPRFLSEYKWYIFCSVFKVGHIALGHRGCWTSVWSLWCRRFWVELLLILKRRAQIHLLWAKVCMQGFAQHNVLTMW